MTSLNINQRSSIPRSSILYKACAQFISNIKMNTLNNQTLWANSLNVDEVVPWEVKNLCNLVNAIFSDAIANQINKLRKEKCCGCEVNHPSQKRHECLMMSEEEGWIMHGLEAIERVIESQIVWKHFIEAIRVMKLDYHEHVTKHFKNLTENHETTLELLKDLKFSFSEYQAILGYLSYWSEYH